MNALPFQNRWSTLMLVGAVVVVVLALFDGDNGDGPLVRMTQAVAQRAANSEQEAPAAAIPIIDDRAGAVPVYSSAAPDDVSGSFTPDTELVDVASGTAATAEP